MGKWKKTSEYTAESTRYCEVCKISVKIGKGGDGNWRQHEQGASHKSLAKSQKAAQDAKGGIMKFLQRAEKQNLAVRSTTSTSKQSSSIDAVAAPVHERDTGTTRAAAEPLPLSMISPLFLRFKNSINCLPSTVPESVEGESSPLSMFACHPSTYLEDDSDIWECLDPVLNGVIGVVVAPSVTDLSLVIRRGRLGIEALYDFLFTCVYELGVDERLVEGKITRLVEAMALLLPVVAESSVVDTAAANLDVIDVDMLVEEQAVVPDQRVSNKTKLPASGAVRAKAFTVTCPGYMLAFPPTKVPLTAYPYHLHVRLRVPWTLNETSDGQIILRAKECPITYEASCEKSKKESPCTYCRVLDTYTVVMGIRHRAQNGTHENTAWCNRSPEDMLQGIRQKTEAHNSLKLRLLNAVRRLAVSNRHLDAWKRLPVAIASNNIPRIQSLLAVQCRAGASIFEVLKKIDSAAQGSYRPRDYGMGDFQKAYLIYKLGGRSAAQIAHLPSIQQTKRHVKLEELLPSTGFPTERELHANLHSCYPSGGESGHTNPTDAILPVVMSIDEIKVTERLRWYEKTNDIVGVCREHGGICSRKFESISDADALLALLKEDRVHLASEATVIGSSVISEDPMQYTTRPFVVSGTCKRELVEDQQRLLGDAVQAMHSVLPKQNLRLYSIATDGDSRRRRALIPLTLCSTPDSSSALYARLKGLKLFNMRCGKNQETSDFDWKHCLKRLRNTDIRAKGFAINGTNITSSTLKAHFLQDGMDESTADSLLMPNDKQDVVLMMRLLNSIALLKPASSSMSPAFAETRRALRLIGQLYSCLLRVYLDTSLSLRQQLILLSTASHLLLAIYHVDKGSFIPVQTFHDLQALIKNVYFCVAKAQEDNPNGKFYVILMGTDGLEKIFGKVRTMIGNDTNADTPPHPGSVIYNDLSSAMTHDI